ncbi:response regulator [Vibrio scophthalmi]|uniref:response regulator n=1 Tax=Vibrio scophthalmi TaxID=45658 RepID=UPI0038734DE0
MNYFCLSTLSVLIVDDSRLILQYLKDVLISMGFKADKIKTIDRYENGSKLVNQEYGLMICDYHLDNGHNGVDLINLLRSNGVVTSQTVCIMASAEASKDIIHRCIDACVDDYMVKPFDVAFVKSRIVKNLKRNNMKAIGIGCNEHTSKTE